MAEDPEKYDYTVKRSSRTERRRARWGDQVAQGGHLEDGRAGTFGTGIIVAVRVNGDRKISMWYEKQNGTLTYPAPHELQYN